MHIDVAVPVKAHVYQYLTYLYGSDTLPVTAYDPVAFTAFLMLHRSKGYYAPAGNNEYPYSINLRLPEKLAYEGKFFISKGAAVAFNNYVERLLKLQLFGILDLIVVMEMLQIRQGILCFLNRYDIDEKKWRYETLKKAYYRYRKNPAKFYTGMSPKILPITALKKTGKYYKLIKAS